MRIAAIYFVSVIAVAAALANLGPYFRYRHLANDGLPIEGSVIRADCLNHNSFWYRFDVGGREYTANGQGGILKDCGALQPNDLVHVYYLPADPNVSTTGNPANRLSNEIISISMAAVLMPAFAILGVRYKLRRRKGG